MDAATFTVGETVQIAPSRQLAIVVHVTPAGGVHVRRPSGHVTPFLPGALDFRHKLPACQNCGEPITEQRGEGYSVWSHPTHGMHTVCDWREGMAPTTRVATP